MKKRFILCWLSIWLLLELAGCGDVEAIWKQSLSEKLGFDCSQAEMMDSYDSHGGFNGDGSSLYTLQFSQVNAVEALRTIKSSDQWHELPLPDEYTAEIYGLEKEYYYYTPSLIRDDDWDHPLMPRVKNGYYLFIDRGSTLSDDKDAPVSRDYLNYSIAIFDTDHNTLYYGESDS